MWPHWPNSLKTYFSSACQLFSPSHLKQTFNYWAISPDKGNKLPHKMQDNNHLSMNANVAMETVGHQKELRTIFNIEWRNEILWGIITEVEKKINFPFFCWKNSKLRKNKLHLKAFLSLSIGWVIRFKM